MIVLKIFNLFCNIIVTVTNNYYIISKKTANEKQLMDITAKQIKVIVTSVAGNVTINSK